MARRASPADVLRRTRQEANRYADKVGKQRLRKLLEKAQADLARRLTEKERLRGAGTDTFSAVQMRLTLAQIKQVLKELSPEFQKLIQAQGKEAAERQASALLTYMQSAEQRFRGIATRLPLKEASMIDRVSQKTDASVLRRIAAHPDDPKGKGILARYGMNVIKSFEDELQIGLATRKPWGEVRGELLGKSSFLQQAPAHWAERIVRTETMAAAGKSAWETTREADAVLGDMVKILSATFDNRTSWDSYQVHGQIRRPDEAFAWKGGSYQHPPNRPNDREVAIPHRISWPIPPYLTPKSDGEVAARFAAEGRKGSPGPRPDMSTVDRSLFGKEPSAVALGIIETPQELEKVSVSEALPKVLEREPQDIVFGEKGHFGELRIDKDWHASEQAAARELANRFASELPAPVKNVMARIPATQLRLTSDTPGAATYSEDAVQISLYPFAREKRKAKRWGAASTVSVSQSQKGAYEQLQATMIHEVGHHLHLGVLRSKVKRRAAASWDSVTDTDEAVRAIVDRAWDKKRQEIERWRGKEVAKMPTVSTYAQTNRYEYFAECWSAWVEDPVRLRKIDSDGADMVENVYNRVMKLKETVK